MADIFNSKPGIVSVISSDQAVPAHIKIGDFEPAVSLISGIDYDQRSNQQFQYSMDKNVYIYVFGDLMGTVSVRGLAFPRACSGGDRGGLEEVFDYYRTNRASANTNAITVVIGKESIVGFLTAMRIRVTNTSQQSSAALYGYELIIQTLPRG